MSYLATLGDQEFRVEVRADGGGVLVRLGDREIPVDVLSVGAGLYSLLIEGSSYEVDILEGEEALIVLVRGQAFPVAIQDERKRRLQAADKGDTRGGRWTITAPMTGKVVRHLVQAGEAVQAGDGVTVLEAMKMENELKAPVAGTVKEIRVTEGAVVNSGDVVAVIE
ncbi:MAG: biotin/lipoyl-containing protein [Dehalococcoidia bacterium]